MEFKRQFNFLSADRKIEWWKSASSAPYGRSQILRESTKGVIPGRGGRRIDIRGALTSPLVSITYDSVWYEKGTTKKCCTAAIVFPSGFSANDLIVRVMEGAREF